ncbi:hypothetical protein HXZ66_01565 [Bacillus sp. A116_S68]|nr:hypothetical protein HXZ66_01565 [Bacillus sp. A116_S68]
MTKSHEIPAWNAPLPGCAVQVVWDVFGQCMFGQSLFYPQAYVHFLTGLEGFPVPMPVQHTAFSISHVPFQALHNQRLYEQRGLLIAYSLLTDRDLHASILWPIEAPS